MGRRMRQDRDMRIVRPGEDGIAEHVARKVRRGHVRRLLPAMGREGPLVYE